MRTVQGSGYGLPEWPPPHLHPIIQTVDKETMAIWKVANIGMEWHERRASVPPLETGSFGVGRVSDLPEGNTARRAFTGSRHTRRLR